MAKNTPRKRNHSIRNSSNADVTKSHDDSQPITRTPGKHFKKPSQNILRQLFGPVVGDLIQSKVTACLLVVFIYYQYTFWSTPKYNVIRKTEPLPEKKVESSPILSHTSLFVPFTVDQSEILQIRSQNIKKWWKHHGVRFDYDESGIDRRSNLSLQEFWDVYDGKWPVLLTDVVPQWPAYNWTGEFFNETYGKERVTMKAVDLQLDAAISEAFSVVSDLPREVLASPPHQGGLSQAVSLAIPLHMFYKNSNKAKPTAWTYVEDELFIPMRPQLKKDIGDTAYLEEDFFKLFPEDVRPWDAMLLWGTKYSRSSLHMDPYNWTGTNAVIRGRKRWKMYPPGQDQYLYIKPNKKSGFPLDCNKYNSPVDAFDPDLEKYPLFKKASSILFEQLPGELLIIPSGWYHQAYNGDETLAISSQVMNRNNYRTVLEEVFKAENVYREQLPIDIDQMSPQQQVETVMSLLPKKLLERGRAVTQDSLKQIKMGQKKNNEPYFGQSQH